MISHLRNSLGIGTVIKITLKFLCRWRWIGTFKMNEKWFDPIDGRNAHSLNQNDCIKIQLVKNSYVAGKVIAMSLVHHTPHKASMDATNKHLFTLGNNTWLRIALHQVPFLTVWYNLIRLEIKTWYLGFLGTCC